MYSPSDYTVHLPMEGVLYVVIMCIMYSPNDYTVHLPMEGVLYVVILCIMYSPSDYTVHLPMEGVLYVVIFVTLLVNNTVLYLTVLEVHLSSRGRERAVNPIEWGPGEGQPYTTPSDFKIGFIKIVFLNSLLTMPLVEKY